MGAGGSLEHQQIFRGEQNTTQPRYFCHSCFRISRIEPSIHAVCPNCESAFVEEMETRPMASDNLFLSNSGNRVGLHDARNEFRLLSIDQTIRINSATSIMRLLETHLRDELDNLQAAFANASLRNNQEGKKSFSKIMSSKLRHQATLTVDMVCSQPGCPICSENFVVANDETQLPCGHLFHKGCIIPWLETKQNCPVCRHELNNDVPTQEELQTYLSDSELLEKLRELNVDVIDEGLTHGSSDRFEELHDDDTTNTMNTTGNGDSKSPVRCVSKDGLEPTRRSTDSSSPKSNEAKDSCVEQEEETSAVKGSHSDREQDDEKWGTQDDEHTEGASGRKGLVGPDCHQQFNRSMNLARLLRKQLLIFENDMRNVDALREVLPSSSAHQNQPSHLAMVNIGRGGSSQPLTAVAIRPPAMRQPHASSESASSGAASNSIEQWPTDGVAEPQSPRPS